MNSLSPRTKPKTSKDLKAELAALFAERIQTGLSRHAVSSASKWATKYRIMKDGPWNFANYPWQVEMHDTKHERCVGQKAAQMGFTEVLLNLAFYCIDILGKDVLYVLPNKTPDAGDFSSARFDGARELSPHLMKLFTNTDNIGHKRAGSANWYIRGSNSKAGLKSLPVSRILMDEVAEFVEENIPLAFERVSGQMESQIWMVSTPNIEGHGISKYFNQSDKRSFEFKCPSCTKYITLKYPESFVIVGESREDPRIHESHYICYECKAHLPHATKSEWLKTAIWVPQFANREWAGYSVNQMYSPTIKPVQLARAVFGAQLHPAEEVELYNSKLGLSHEAKGARVSEEDIENCIKKGIKNRKGDPIYRNSVITMGVDIGRWIHWEVDKWVFDQKINGDMNTRAKCIVVEHGKVKTFEELDELMSKFSVLSCVIDRHPEFRSALDFSKRFPGRVNLCFFARGVNGRTLVKPKDPQQGETTIAVDRSSWLDLALGRFKNGTISLPIDTHIEYREHVKQPVKTYVKDSDGHPVAKYLTAENQDDHYAFARLYAEIALSLIGGYSATIEIDEDL